MILHRELLSLHFNRRLILKNNLNFSKQKIRFLSTQKNEEENLYHVLGLTTDADQKQIKAHFYKLSKQYHPDKNPSDEAAARYFKQITEAYDVLSNPDSKDAYDFRNGFITKSSKTYIKPRKFNREAVHETFTSYKDRFKEDVKTRLEKEGEKMKVFTERTKKKYTDPDFFTEDEHTRKIMEHLNDKKPKWDFGEDDHIDNKKGTHGNQHKKDEYIKDDPIFYGTKSKGNQDLIQEWLNKSYENTANFKENIKGMKNFQPFSYQQTTYQGGQSSTREVKMNPGIIVACVFLIILFPTMELFMDDNYDLIVPSKDVKK